MEASLYYVTEYIKMGNFTAVSFLNTDDNIQKNNKENSKNF